MTVSAIGVPDFPITQSSCPAPPRSSQDLKDLAPLIPGDARVAQPPSAVAGRSLGLFPIRVHSR